MTLTDAQTAALIAALDRMTGEEEADREAGAAEVRRIVERGEGTHSINQP